MAMGVRLGDLSSLFRPKPLYDSMKKWLDVSSLLFCFELNELCSPFDGADQPEKLISAVAQWYLYYISATAHFLGVHQKELLSCSSYFFVLQFLQEIFLLRGENWAFPWAAPSVFVVLPWVSATAMPWHEQTAGNQWYFHWALHDGQESDGIWTGSSYSLGLLPMIACLASASSAGNCKDLFFLVLQSPWGWTQTSATPLSAEVC